MAVDMREVELKRLQGDLNNARDEYPRRVKQRDIHKEQIVMLEKHIETTKKLHELMLKGMKRLKPEFEFQTTPEFIALSADLQEISNWKELKTMELEKEKILEIIKGADEEIARLDKIIPELEARIAKLKTE